MWTFEHSRTSNAGVIEVFAMLSDVAGWPEWNAGVESVSLDGPFVARTAGVMAMPGQEPLSFRLIWVDPRKGFEDETDLPDAGVVVRVRHTIEALPKGGTRITYRATIEGPAADEVGPELGPAITADFPSVIGALAERAESVRVASSPG
jgi:uncharacterized protein YndB with AHSA1/START domain